MIHRKTVQSWERLSLYNDPVILWLVAALKANFDILEKIVTGMYALER